MGTHQGKVTSPAAKRRRGRSHVARRRGRRTRRLEAVCPLALWRTRDPARISPAEVLRLARTVAGTEILHERRWREARAGDAAAAAAIAIDHLHRRTAWTPLTDVILGNLVILALRGDPTAAVVIAHALRTFGRLDPAGRTLGGLSARWGNLHASPRRRTGTEAAFRPGADV